MSGLSLVFMNRSDGNDESVFTQSTNVLNHLEICEFNCLTLVTDLANSPMSHLSLFVRAKVEERLYSVIVPTYSVIYRNYLHLPGKE